MHLSCIWDVHVVYLSMYLSCICTLSCLYFRMYMIYTGLMYFNIYLTHTIRNSSSWISQQHNNTCHCVSHKLAVQINWNSNGRRNSEKKQWKDFWRSKKMVKSLNFFLDQCYDRYSRVLYVWFAPILVSLIHIIRYF